MPTSNGMALRTASERIGTVLAGKYALIRVLGEGGMGIVYEATHEWTGRRVAVKLLQPALALDPEMNRRFLQEARSASAIEHPNVVQVLDMGSDDDGTAFLVLELLTGEPLSKRLEVAALSLAEMLEVLLPVMSALASAHDNRLIHRDLKPENIFVAEQAGERIPKVLDFGLAKIVQGDLAASSDTRPGALVGTPYYLAPEQALADRSISIGADVWAMGVVVYQCLTRRLPFPGESLTAVLVAVCERKPAPLSELDPALAAIVLRALEKAPANRYPDMRAFAGALVDYARRKGIDVKLPKALAARSSAHPAHAIEEQRMPRALVAFAVFAISLFFAGGTVLGLGLFMPRAPQSASIDVASHAPAVSPPEREQRGNGPLLLEPIADPPVLAAEPAVAPAPPVRPRRPVASIARPPAAPPELTPAPAPIAQADPVPAPEPVAQPAPVAQVAVGPVPTHVRPQPQPQPTVYTQPHVSLPPPLPPPTSPQFGNYKSKRDT
jgi:eukaryotic-like serine/threonine-protein kinase